MPTDLSGWTVAELCDEYSHAKLYPVEKRDEARAVTVIEELERRPKPSEEAVAAAERIAADPDEYGMGLTNFGPEGGGGVDFFANGDPAIVARELLRLAVRAAKGEE